MSGFVYFIPDVSQASDEVIAERGLSYAVAGCPSRSCSPGPDGLKGCTVADPKRVPTAKFGYFKDRQTWRKIPGSDCYVGYETASPPTPEQLLRAEHLRKSHPVELGDGNQWLVPIARSVAELDGQLVPYITLPQVSDLDDEGNWTTARVVARYERLWELAQQYYDHLIAALQASSGTPGEHDKPGTITVTFDFQNLHAAAVEVLSANYAVSAVECAALGLLTREHARDVLRLLIDLPGLEALQKKITEPAAG